MKDEIKVFDKGYVKLRDVFGNDLTVVNAARVSYDKQVNELTPQDKQFIKNLVVRGETSPFRHCVLTFEIKAPLFVARQWWRYSVASAVREEMFGWNEKSLRYTEEYDFYIPEYLDSHCCVEYLNSCMYAMETYDYLITSGVKKETARGVLPASVYTRWIWTPSLQTVIHFLRERLDRTKTQYETYCYASAVCQLTNRYFSVSLQHSLPNLEMALA